jgi:hypothetical protein
MNKNEANPEMPTSQRRDGVLQAVGKGDEGLHLTAGERRLILNYRAVEACAQEMLVDLSGQYKRTFPAEPVKLTLVVR